MLSKMNTDGLKNNFAQSDVLKKASPFYEVYFQNKLLGS